MSLYQVQKFLYKLNRDEQMQIAFNAKKSEVLSNYKLTEEEHAYDAFCDFLLVRI